MLAYAFISEDQIRFIEVPDGRALGHIPHVLPPPNAPPEEPRKSMVAIIGEQIRKLRLEDKGLSKSLIV